MCYLSGHILTFTWIISFLSSSIWNLDSYSNNENTNRNHVVYDLYLCSLFDGFTPRFKLTNFNLSGNSLVSQLSCHNSNWVKLAWLYSTWLSFIWLVLTQLNISLFQKVHLAKIFSIFSIYRSYIGMFELLWYNMHNKNVKLIEQVFR